MAKQVIMSVSLVLLGVCCALLIRSWCWPCRTCGHTSEYGRNLFFQAAGVQNASLAARVRAAKELGKNLEHEPWVILLLLSYQRQPIGNSPNAVIGQHLRTHDLGVVAVMVRAFPKDVPVSVLFALTLLLDETEQGRWCEEKGIFNSVRASCSSPPIREVVRQCLLQRVGFDCGWDKEAWQRRIVAMIGKGAMK